MIQVPDVAVALMPLCEAFGSIAPPPNHKSTILGETSVYSVFSCAFLCLLRLWKFYRPPQEYCLAGRGGSVKLELTLDYLLLMRNNRIEFSNSSAPNRDSYNNMGSVNEVPAQPIYIDSFPKLRAWYFQNQACIASTLSGFCNKNPVHQVANKILNMICRKMNKSGVSSSNLSSTSSSSVSGSSVSASDDSCQRPAVPAWEFLEAVPFVLEAVLTACAHGRLSSRDLTTSELIPHIVCWWLSASFYLLMLPYCRLKGSRGLFACFSCCNCKLLLSRNYTRNLETCSNEWN